MKNGKEIHSRVMLQRRLTVLINKAHVASMNEDPLAARNILLEGIKAASDEIDRTPRHDKAYLGYLVTSLVDLQIQAGETKDAEQTICSWAAKNILHPVDNSRLASMFAIIRDYQEDLPMAVGMGR